jgi:holo-[acyl-carrier protein] synthase
VIVGVGLDVVEVARIRSLAERRGERFTARVFTPEELACCEAKADPAPSLAARFAAKEAGMKALGSGWGEGVGWQDLAVVSPPGRPPALELRGEAAARASRLGVSSVHLSLSHDAGVAAAVVVLESR